MKVSELIEILKTFPAEAEVRVFAAFDDNGPCTWETPEVYMCDDDGSVRIDRE